MEKQRDAGSAANDHQQIETEGARAERVDRIALVCVAERADGYGGRHSPMTLNRFRIPRKY
jgi:hypothetical protein